MQYFKATSIISGLLSTCVILSFSMMATAQDQEMQQQPQESAPIVEELHDAGYTEFANVLEESGIAAQLGDMEVTVFAPTDEAFENLPPEVEADERQLATIAMGHIAQGETHADELSDGGHVQAVNGQPVEVEAEDDMIMIGNAPVTQPDMEVDGGVIHEVGDIILPDEGQQQQAPPQDDPPDPDYK